jgi:hypothetical protein
MYDTMYANRRYKMDIYEVRDYIISIINDAIINNNLPDEWQVWSTIDGWQIMDNDGNQLDINVTIF